MTLKIWVVDRKDDKKLCWIFVNIVAEIAEVWLERFASAFSQKYLSIYILFYMNVYP